MATINVHQTKDGSKAYRVRIRRKGQPVQTASFSSLKDARKWATMIGRLRLHFFPSHYGHHLNPIDGF